MIIDDYDDDDDNDDVCRPVEELSLPFFIEKYNTTIASTHMTALFKIRTIFLKIRYNSSSGN